MYTPTDSFDEPVVIEPETFTFPFFEYRPIDPFPTVIFPVLSSSNPYIPTELLPTVIFPLFCNGFVPVEVAFVYIATFGLLIEAEFPNVIFPLFTVLYDTPFCASFANIPTFLSPVLVMLPVDEFSNVTDPVIFPGS